MRRDWKRKSLLSLTRHGFMSLSTFHRKFSYLFQMTAAFMLLSQLPSETATVLVAFFFLLSLSENLQLIFACTYTDVCLTSSTGFTHVEWLYCILHSESKATAARMWSSGSLSGIAVSGVSSPMWLVGSSCWYLCFALSNRALQLFDLVDTLNTSPRKTGLVSTYPSWKSLSPPPPESTGVLDSVAKN